MCECYQIGGPWIGADPSCPAHGDYAVQEREAEEARMAALESQVASLLQEVADLREELAELRDQRASEAYSKAMEGF